jgi:hypothetical protein
MPKHTTSRGFAAFGALLALAFVAAFAIAGQLASGLICGGVLLAYLGLVVVGGRRSPTLQTLSATGDERSTSIYQRAAAIAGGLLVVVILAWWLVSVARGHENTTLPPLAAAFGACFILAFAVLQRRS